MNTLQDTLLSASSVRETVAAAAAKGAGYLVADAAVAAIYPGIEEACRSLGMHFFALADAPRKSLGEAAAVWRFLSSEGARRDSVVALAGGGSLTDAGGFAAATFKRGIGYINIPTTLLAAVDASVGGKTGVDFGGLKNEVGAFRLPLATILCSEWLRTLPHSEIMSGYGEMLKTAFLQGEREAAAMMRPQLLPDMRLIESCARFKLGVVERDPFEKGERRVLNLGHTAGHAFESLCRARGGAVSHGAAVAQGLLVSLILSHMREGLDAKWISSFAALLREEFTPVRFGCRDYPALLELMRHDKKNLSDGGISFVLLRVPGEPLCGIRVLEKEICAALDITADSLGF